MNRRRWLSFLRGRGPELGEGRSAFESIKAQIFIASHAGAAPLPSAIFVLSRGEPSPAPGQIEHEANDREGQKRQRVGVWAFKEWIVRLGPVAKQTVHG